jgi:hypothetical protein
LKNALSACLPGAKDRTGTLSPKLFHTGFKPLLQQSNLACVSQQILYYHCWLKRYLHWVVEHGPQAAMGPNDMLISASRFAILILIVTQAGKRCLYLNQI